jgi:hypothetical protein
MVARIVRNMDGQLRLKSEEGQGSRFVMQLPFELPKDAAKELPAIPAVPSRSPSHEFSVRSSLNDLDEVMLVDKVRILCFVALG